ncbi:SAV_915 family protein [Streptomyces sp. NPDC058955]|uniref:SAV_915 family protein n=1 Tax=unclassified Streptomyces TaxID=2593676 RepID=UPI003647092C
MPHTRLTADRGPADRGRADRGPADSGREAAQPADAEPADPAPVAPESAQPEPAAQESADPDPLEPVPGGRLCVPVRPGSHGVSTRLFRTPVGTRTAVAFTRPERLRATLGADQPWIPLSEPALRALARPLGVHALTVDPVLTAPYTPAPTRETVSDLPQTLPATLCARRADAFVRGTDA